MPRYCNCYVTLRCNDTCEFCPIWEQKKYKDLPEKPYDLTPLKTTGVNFLNVTGGEPLLREDLPDILKQAKSLGFKIEMATNGILYPERARALKGLIDNLYFSLDYPVPEEHDRSRGVDCFHAVIKAIKLAQDLGERPIINYTLTRDSVRFLPEMIELAERLGVYIYLNPVYGFFGTQGFEESTYAHIRYYGRRRKVLLNLAALEFVKFGGNKTIFPRCRAKETIVTLLPDGSRISPCFFNPDGVEGRANICSDCLRWPYMLQSFSVGIDKFFFLFYFSELVNRIKEAKR